MGHLGEDIKNLGFGLMRLPRREDDSIDVEQVKEMVDLFMDAGCTYFDTAFVYNGSEDAIKEALVDRYPRESFQLATKMAAWIGCKTREEAISQFTASLERTGAGYFDFYLLHNVGDFKTKAFNDFGLWDWIIEQKAAGTVRHIGFSYHASPEELDRILTEHPEMEFVQLQINYADWENPAIKSRECYEVVRRHGKSVVIMEPVKGGLLADPPEAVANILKAAEPDMSVASWAVRFAAALEGLITVLSGMSSVEQMKDNLSYMKDFRGLTASERETIAKAQEEMAKIDLIPCTSCNYCAKVCPKDIGISGSFTAMNLLTLYGNKDFAAGQEGFLVGAYGRQFAKNCVKCGKCEQVCPQHIAIRDNLEKVAATFPHEDPAPAEA